jgi:hypothetical protein
MTREYRWQVLGAVDLNQRTAQRDGEIDAARGKRPLSIDSLKNDPLVREDAGGVLQRILQNWLAVPLRASRQNARVDRLMALVGFFEPLQLPRSSDSEDIFTSLVRHERRLTGPSTTTQ